MSRGGKREGAGRPKEAPTVSMSFRFTEKEREVLRLRAKQVGLSVSEYVKINTIGGKGLSECNSVPVSDVGMETTTSVME